MSDTWDEWAGTWDGNEVVVAYANKAFQGLDEVVDLEGIEVFDFGCGTGLLTQKISALAKTVVSLDTSPKMIEVLEAKGLPNVTAVCRPLSGFNLADHNTPPTGFDLVTASSVCAFVPDYEDTVARLKGMLKPGGVLVQWDWYAESESSGPGFTTEGLKTVLEAAGFRSVSVTTAFSMPSPAGEAAVLMAVARL